MTQTLYDEHGITIVHGRAEDVLPTLGDKSIDLVLTDPPYAEQTHVGARGGASTGGNRHSLERVKPIVDFDSITFEELQAHFDRIGRVANGWVVSFMDWRHTVQFETTPPQGLRFVRFGVWVKPDGTPQFTGDRPATGWEAIAIMHRLGGRMEWNGGGYPAVWTFNRTPKGGVIDHPTSKPLPLVCELVRLFSNPGDLVLDPFGGSGVVAHACRLLDRRCIVVEREYKHALYAASRLARIALLPGVVEQSYQQEQWV